MSRYRSGYRYRYRSWYKCNSILWNPETILNHPKAVACVFKTSSGYATKAAPARSTAPSAA